MRNTPERSVRHLRRVHCGERARQLGRERLGRKLGQRSVFGERAVQRAAARHVEQQVDAPLAAQRVEQLDHCDSRAM